MDNRIPRSTLEQLHRELMKARSEEHQVQKRLDELARDVRQMLDKPAEEHLHHRTFKENLRDSVRHLEASHPELTSVINNVLTTLTKMGI
jgi:predicted transcriptional regulator